MGVKSRFGYRNFHRLRRSFMTPRAAAARAATETVNFPDYVTNARAREWISDMVALCKPADVHFVDGSEEENARLGDQMVASGVLIKLDEKLRPSSYLARSHPSDVARMEDRTF